MRYFQVRKQILRIFYCSPLLKKMKKIFLRRMGVEIGDNVIISYDFMLSDRASDRSLLKIGNNVDISAKVVAVTTSGPKHSNIKSFYPIRALPINICDDVWIGTNVIILPGVTIGRGSIIGAGCVISKDIPPYSIVSVSEQIVKSLPENLIKIIEK